MCHINHQRHHYHSMPPTSTPPATISSKSKTTGKPGLYTKTVWPNTCATCPLIASATLSPNIFAPFFFLTTLFNRSKTSS
mmetsp:Transcript_30080/g.63919  ORF Transcript_30080/g.63919 Transcript_30080/m.63919 type:complete len:80 (+) Transcript_30080:63-302(+)